MVASFTDITERWALEAQLRQQAEELRNLSLTDELTGLYNRRGLLMLAEQQLKTAQRTHSKTVVLVGDLDGLKVINDTWGHEAGSEALVATAAVLRATFRESDLLARWGGDEFVVVATGSDRADIAALRERLDAQLAAYNTTGNSPYPLAMSVGVVVNDPAAPCALATLLARADALMYEHKRQRRQDRVIELAVRPNLRHSA